MMSLKILLLLLRLVRLIVSNTSSGGSTHCSDGSSDAKADFLFRGPPVCLIRDIRDKRMNAMLAHLGVSLGPILVHARNQPK